MGRHGPQPTPTAIKKARGNPGGRPLPKNEAKPPQELSLDAPDHLPEVAKVEWRRIATELASQNLLTSWDLTAFEGYCEAYATYRSACVEIKSHGRILTTPNGCKQVNPYWTIRRQSLAECMKIGATLGLNPAARVGLDTAKTGMRPEDRRSEADKDFGRRTGT
jgi:P27 family predicted phage terminase small subunit